MKLIFAICLILGLTLAAAWAGEESLPDFDGKVEVHIKHVAPGEDLIQILDHTRGVVCYGKMNSGGAATISCQKFSEPAQPAKKR